MANHERLMFQKPGNFFFGDDFTALEAINVEPQSKVTIPVLITPGCLPAVDGPFTSSRAIVQKLRVSTRSQLMYAGFQGSRPYSILESADGLTGMAFVTNYGQRCLEIIPGDGLARFYSPLDAEQITGDELRDVVEDTNSGLNVTGSFMNEWNLADKHGTIIPPDQKEIAHFLALSLSPEHFWIPPSAEPLRIHRKGEDHRNLRKSSNTLQLIPENVNPELLIVSTKSVVTLGRGWNMLIAAVCDRDKIIPHALSPLVAEIETDWQVRAEVKNSRHNRLINPFLLLRVYRNKEA